MRDTNNLLLSIVGMAIPSEFIPESTVHPLGISTATTGSLEAFIL